MKTTYLRQVLLRFQMDALGVMEQQIHEQAAQELRLAELADAPLTPENLLSIGCKKFQWQPGESGQFFEYFYLLPVRVNENKRTVDGELSVVFDGGNFACRLILPKTTLYLPGVRTVSQFLSAIQVLSVA